MLLPMVASAQSIEIDGIYYNIIAKGQIAEVVQNPQKYSGDIVIPASVTYDGKDYSVTSIGSNAFNQCSSLTSITIPNSVTSFGNNAFNSCSSLTSITIPNSVTSIGGGAFKYCSSLTNIAIPNSVTSIGSQAFCSCSSLTNIAIPNSVTFIGSNAFMYCSSLTNIAIPNSVTSIEGYTFQNCSSLTSVIIPNSVTSIGSYAFQNCSSLTNISIPNSVTLIGFYAFSSCSSLTSVIIPNSVTYIQDGAFYECSSLANITISNSTPIRSYTFASCKELTDVYCYAEEVPSAWSDAFKDSFIEYATLHVPANSVNAYQTTEPWKFFGTIVPLGDTPGPQKCATPVISYKDGKLSLSCDTEDVEFVTNVECMDNKKSYDKEIPLSARYIVSAYAMKAGYDNSDVATAEIDVRGLKGDVNGDGLVNVTDIVMTVNIIMSGENK